MKEILVIISMIFVVTGCVAPPQIAKIEATSFYPPFPGEPRIQFLTSLTSEEDLGKEQSAFEEFLLGTKPSSKSIVKPYDIHAEKGKIYIMDLSFKSIIVINLDEKTFDNIGNRPGTFSSPAGFWISNHEFYVADHGRKQISVVDSNGNFLREYGKDILEKPLDVAVYGDKVYVCDFKLSQIIVFDRDSGDVLYRIGELGTADGLLYQPTHITFDNNGNLFVNDAFNFRIQKFDSLGDFVMKYGFLGDTPGAFARPKGIAVSNEDHLYAVDTAFENVQIFDAITGDLLLNFGGYGNKLPGDMYMPSAIYIDYDNVEYFRKYAHKNFHLEYLIYVANRFGKQKMNIYGFGEWTGQLRLE